MRREERNKDETEEREREIVIFFVKIHFFR